MGCTYCNKKKHDITYKDNYITATFEANDHFEDFGIELRPIDKKTGLGAYVHYLHAPNDGKEDDQRNQISHKQVMSINGESMESKSCNEITQILSERSDKIVYFSLENVDVTKEMIKVEKEIKQEEENLKTSFKSEEVYDHNYAVTFNPDNNKNLMHTIKEDYQEDNNSEEEDEEDGWEDDSENENKEINNNNNKKKKKKKKTKFKAKTYVHDTLSANIRPWFQAHEIEDNSYSVLVNEVYPSSTAESYQGIFMVPMVMIGGLFAGKYLYRKFFKKTPAKKFSME